MEVSERKESFNVDSGKEVILCQPCQSDNESVPAEGYCDTCNEFICTSCIKAHQKLATTKNHVIKSKDEMPNTKTQTDPCTELCVVHKTEIVKFYCDEHDCVGCGDCMVLEHRTCKIQLVSDVSGNYRHSDELFRIKHTLNYLKKNLTACKYKISQSVNVAEETKTKVVEEIRKFREEMNIYLNKVEANLIEEVEQMSVNSISDQTKLQEQCKCIEIEMTEFQSKLNQCSDKTNQLFVTSKLLQRRLQKCQDENVDISSRSQITTCTFELSRAMKDLKANMTPLGTLTAHTNKFTGPCKKSIIGMKAHFENKINVQAAKEENCWITGMAMISPDEILMADNNNRSLKIVNVKEGKITLTYTPSSSPWDVTLTNADTAAVTLPNEGKIVFMNTRNGLSDSHFLNVRHGCYGIDHKSDIMAVSFCFPPAIQVLDITGNILHVVHDTTEVQIPYYIAMGNDKESMFVSDNGNNSVFEFTEHIHLKAIIKSMNLNYAAGLVSTCDETVVVCGSGESGKVKMIVPGTKEILPLLLQDVHVEMAWSTLVCENQNKLFICELNSSEESNKVKIFDLK